MNQQNLQQENRDFDGTAGVSKNNQAAGFRPAFRDEATGRVELARFSNGSVATMHIFTYLPKDWGKTFNCGGGIAELKDGIVCGFVRDDEFFTRAEVANLIK